MKSSIFAFCKKCNTDRHKRLSSDKRRKNLTPYYACSYCLESNTRKYRKKNWEYTLAKKANGRKRPGSDLLDKQDIKLLYQKQDGKCAISGNMLDTESYWEQPSLDRIDNKLGYTKDNIQLVTWKVNHSRGELSIQEFIEMCKKVAENSGVCGL